MEKSITDAFKKVVKTSRRKPKRLWVDQDTEFYNRVFREWLEKNDVEMYSVYNEGKAVVVERFNRTMKEWMWRYFSANNTHRYYDILDTLISSYNAKFRRSIKMSSKNGRPMIKSLKKNETKVYRNLYGDLSALEPQLPKFKVGDNVRMIKKKSMFEKGYTPRWTEEIFKINEVQMTRPVTYKLENLNEE